VLQEVVERVFTRKDVLDACKRRDLGAVITALGTEGVTQGQLSVLTGIPQGRLSEYKNRKRKPTATATFEAFAGGLGMPAAACRALGLDPEAAGSDLPRTNRRRSTALTAVGQADLRPVLSTMSTGTAMPVLLAATSPCPAPIMARHICPADGVTRITRPELDSPGAKWGAIIGRHQPTSGFAGRSKYTSDLRSSHDEPH
jgi:hypothetical protein